MYPLYLDSGVCLSYEDYLKSPEWQKKRTERMKIDNFRCANCSRPMDLQVHHINYDRLGDEDVYRDLITLCKFCHKKIEDDKKIPAWRYESQSVFFSQFWSDIEGRDKSNGGSEDFCDYETIEKAWFQWLKDNKLYDQFANLNVPKTKTQKHFRNIRIKKILKWKAQGATPEEIYLYGGVSKNMVYKYYNNEQLAQSVMNNNS